MTVESAGVITAESMAEALAAVSFVKKEAVDKSDVNLDMITEEEQLAYAIRISILQEDW